MENLDKYLEWFLMLVGLFASIATVTPNDSDNKIVQIILTIINKLGLNFGKASNG